MLKCKTLGENRGITCGPNQLIHPFCFIFPMKKAGQQLNVHTWFFIRFLRLTELTFLVSSQMLCLDIHIFKLIGIKSPYLINNMSAGFIS